MSEITVLFLYIIAGSAFAFSRLPSQENREKALLAAGFGAGLAALLWHAVLVWGSLKSGDGLSLSLATTTSFIGLQLALIALLGALQPTLRGLGGGLLILAAVCAVFTSSGSTDAPGSPMSWQLQGHVLISLFAYGLLTVGAIVALYALAQDRRLRSGQLSSVNQLFAPLETTERLLFTVTGSGFAILLVAVLSGLAFVENLFAQHLVHKTVLSIAALALFGLLLAGRQFAGWRGRQAIYLYLGGFVILCLAYYGSRFILENVLGRSWG